MRLHKNASPKLGESLTDADRTAFGATAVRSVRRYLKNFELPETPLVELPALATALGIKTLLVKDESGRSSVGSFKALGGAHAVSRVVHAEAERRLGRKLDPERICDRDVAQIARSLTVCCATDGNHGRAVAASARILGCNAAIFVHSGVSEARVAAIRDRGATVTRIQGSYDDSVDAAAKASKEAGWHLVSDTAWPGYEDIPSAVMQGYLVMVDEALQQMRQSGHSATHVFLQAGVGSFAAAVAAHLSLRMAPAAPRFIIVEPERAACLLESATANRRMRIPVGPPTMMAMLECYEPSLIAWRILERVADSFIAINDHAALCAMRRMAAPLADDPSIQSGESGAAGLAGLIEAAREQGTREALGLSDRAVTLVFNTEGPTDRNLYDSLLRVADRVCRDGSSGEAEGS